MFENNSRYIFIETASHTMPDGRVVAYTRRRFVPRAESIPTLVEIRTTQGDRLDLIAYRTLGDPEQFWRICDANNILDPSDLTREVNTLVRIGIPQPGT
jgi:hypothetical protein